MQKPFSEACQRNQEPIKVVLSQYLKNGNLLEIGSGTGQHAVYMGQAFKDITWNTSDHIDYHEGIKNWIKDSGLQNIIDPIFYLASSAQFPNGKYDYVYSANTLHIMSWINCKALFKDLGENLDKGAYVFFYLPFKYNGQFTSKSNESFDKNLRSRGVGSAIRDFEDVKSQMEKEGFELKSDHLMPANNQTLVFKKAT